MRFRKRSAFVGDPGSDWDGSAPAGLRGDVVRVSAPPKNMRCETALNVLSFRLD